MKKLIIITVCALLAVGNLSAQKKSAVSFDAYEWDFGKVDGSLGAICHTFTLQNKSKAPVTISKSIPSCECIQAICPDKAIQPGQKAQVMVVFNPLKTSGSGSPMLPYRKY